MSWTAFRKTRLQDLEKALKERKADEQIVPLLNSINQNKNLVTTSSCFGRIVLLQFDLDQRKKTSKFYKKWHRIVDPEEVELALCGYSEKKMLWFKVEPFILHVAAKDEESAHRFLDKMRRAGVKRGGIQGVQNDRITIEVHGTTYMSFPVEHIEGDWEEIIKTANRMMGLNISQVKKLEKIKF